MNRSVEFLERWEDVEKDILETGTYDLTSEELEYGVQLAWRNEPRCTARIQWGNLVSIFPHYIHPVLPKNSPESESIKLNFVLASV